jgi:hypothetical protein
MVQQHGSQSAPCKSRIPHFLRILGRRIKGMTLVWVLFGTVVGICSEPAQHGSLIGIVSGVIAGMIVMLFLGVILGLLGGQARLALVGGTLGALVGAILALLSGTLAPLPGIGHGLMVGGLIGSTFGIVMWWTRTVAHLVALPLRGR